MADGATAFLYAYGPGAPSLQLALPLMRVWLREDIRSRSRRPPMASPSRIADVEQLVDVPAVEVVGDYRLRLTFEDGTVGEVDFAEREWRGVFEPLRETAYFARVRVDPEAGTVTWPNGADMAPEPLYEAARRNKVAKLRRLRALTERSVPATGLFQRQPSATPRNGESPARTQRSACGGGRAAWSSSVAEVPRRARSLSAVAPRAPRSGIRRAPTAPVQLRARQAIELLRHRRDAGRRRGLPIVAGVAALEHRAAAAQAVVSRARSAGRCSPTITLGAPDRSRAARRSGQRLRLPRGAR